MPEIELKLVADPADLDRLLDDPVLSGPGVTRNLESVYWDTPDRGLLRRAVTLRVRRIGRRHVQTVKDAGETVGLVSHRGEWEGPVPGPALDLAALDPAALERLGPIVAADLSPVFRTRIRRVTRLVPVGDDGRVEVAVDRGEILAADGRREPVSEIEFELKSGPPSALYAVAQAVAATVSVRLDRRTKAERGHALAAGEAAPVRVRRAGTPDLDPDATVEATMAAILREALAHVLENGPAVATVGAVDGVHQMRVGVRRLRSALSLFGPLIPDGRRDALTAELRWIAGELGAARDWDVFHGSLVAPVAAAHGRDGPSVPAFAALDALVAARRTAGHHRAAAAVESPRFARLALALGGWIEGAGWREQAVTEDSARLFDPIGTASAQLLRRRHRRALKRGARFARLGPEPRHRLRIALKRLRYAAEFFRPMYEGKSFGRFHRRLAAFLHRLGHLNDVATAERLVAELEASPDAAGADPAWRLAAGAVIGWHARGLVESEADLVSDWHGFTEVEPDWMQDR